VRGRGGQEVEALRRGGGVQDGQRQRHGEGEQVLGLRPGEAEDHPARARGFVTRYTGGVCDLLRLPVGIAQHREQPGRFECLHWAECTFHGEHPQWIDGRCAMTSPEPSCLTDG
jgi:hypothetical protein